MARSKAATPATDPEAEVKRGRLCRLTVRNFRCIGPEGVSVELDDIVVLVGPNNSGKSSILRAYEAIMQDGSKEGHLCTDDFPDGRPGDGRVIEIELVTEVLDGQPGAVWLADDQGRPWVEGAGPAYVKELWRWTEPGAGKRCGWNAVEGHWDNKVPWGAPNVANARRPEPHPVKAFDPPEAQAKQINDLLRTVIVENAKKLTDENGCNVYERLLADVSAFQELALGSTKDRVRGYEDRLNEIVAAVFADHVVCFTQGHEATEKSVTLFPALGKLLMGPTDGHKAGLDYQGSGARRTMLWAALRLLSEEKSLSGRPHVLLIDEPELCLHPNAVRDACEVLYNLASQSGWQVMITTHSPIFIDLKRDNMSIVRVARTAGAAVTGTTLYRPTLCSLSPNDRENLKLLNILDPHVAEFFFGGRVVIVEGDTEFSVFRLLVDNDRERFRDTHIIRARGKATIASLVKILNHFATPYAVLHDSDSPRTVRRKRGSNDRQEIVNPAWTNNQKILDAVILAPKRDNVLLAASIGNFEHAFYDEQLSGEKPFTAVSKMQNDAALRSRIEELLDSLLDHTKKLPSGVIAWNNDNQLRDAYIERFGSELPHD